VHEEEFQNFSTLLINLKSGSSGALEHWDCGFIPRPNHELFFVVRDWWGSNTATKRSKYDHDVVKWWDL